MEIAVPSSSPLGQYLAEIDAEAEGGESLAQLLHAPPRPVARKRPSRRRAAPVSSDWSWLQLAQKLQRCVELTAVRRMIPELCAFHPTIRDELQQAAGSDAAVFADTSEARAGWWGRHVAVAQVLSGVEVVGVEEIRRTIAMSGVAVVALVAAADASWRESGGVFVLQMFVAVAAFVVLGLELGTRMLLGWYARRSGRLVDSLSGFGAALGKFNGVYADSLTLVKRAELASRGYRLGAGLLPPIGRLEASNAGDTGDADERAAVSAAKNHLRCLPLRRRLRTLNDQLQIHASRLVREGKQATGDEDRDSSVIEDTIDGQAPSLLVTAIAKQHNRAVLVLENAVHSALVRNTARACLFRRDTKVDCSLIGALTSQRVAVDRLAQILKAWIGDLQVWNSTSDLVSLLSSGSEAKSFERKQHEQQMVHSNIVDPRLKEVASQLHELRSTSETLTALAVAAQHDLLAADSAAERLSCSRETMQSMVRQLQEAWGNYDNALSAMIGGEDKPKTTDADAEDGGEDQEVKPIVTEASSSVPAPEDPNCTVVFTGTSTGDDGFDLQVLLKQQEAYAVSASSESTPHFVRELRDVLAHRQAHAQPGFTKQVDHDPPTSAQDAGTEALQPPPLPPNAMFALPSAPPRGRRGRPPPAVTSNNVISRPVANAFNLELQALLRAQPMQPQDSIECVGDSDGDTVVEAETGKKLS